MKFGIAKLPKTFHKNTEKRRNNDNYELSAFEDRKVITNLCYTMEEKVLSLGKFSAVATGSKGALLPFWFTKNAFFETSCNDKKTDDDAKSYEDIISYLLD